MFTDCAWAHNMNFSLSTVSNLHLISLYWGVEYNKVVSYCTLDRVQYSPYTAVKSQEGKLTFRFEAFQPSRNSVCKWRRGDLPKPVRWRMWHTHSHWWSCCTPPLPPPPPSYPFCMSAFNHRRTRTSYTQDQSEACAAMPVTQKSRGVLCALNPSLQRQLPQKVSDLYWIPVSFPVSCLPAGMLTLHLETELQQFPAPSFPTHHSPSCSFSFLYNITDLVFSLIGLQQSRHWHKAQQTASA